MYYQSTRSDEKVLSTNAVLNGIASDGGLYVNPDIAKISFDWKNALKLRTIDMAASILKTLLPDFENMDALVEAAYKGKFETDELTPLVKAGDDYILELFRGPTSAFKDVALSMLPQLITGAKKQTGLKDKIVILTATSGDTGKAALEGFHDVDGVSIIVFYPYGGVSEVQKAQMVTQEGANVKVCAVRGNFDDCQRGVKKAFSDLTERLKNNGVVLSSANSINIGRLAPQVTYYFTAYRDLVNSGRINVGDIVNYVVPTGNFGDILAGYYAKMLGLPVGRLVCASNINNVLTDFINTGVYDKNRPFHKTESPSMDILVSSNLERLLFMASGNSTEKVRAWMKDLSGKGVFSVDKDTLSSIQDTFCSWYCDKEQTEKEIKKYLDERHYLIDPHTAVGCYVAEKFKEYVNEKTKLCEESGLNNNTGALCGNSGKCGNVCDTAEKAADCGNCGKTDFKALKDAPCVILSTASPYKFPTAILNALGKTPDADEFAQMRQIKELTDVPIPKNLDSLKGKEVLHKDVIDFAELEDYILKNI